MGEFYYDKKDYPRWRDSGKLVHRTVAGRLFGLKKMKGKVVHHLDGNKHNFRKSNLWLMTRSAHSQLHARLRKNTWWPF